MPRRTDIQSGRAETQLSDAPPSTEGGAIDHGQDVLAAYQALGDAAAFRAPYSQRPNDAAVSRLLQQSTWSADTDFARWPIAANLLNWSYRLLQLYEGNARSRSIMFRNSMCALPIVTKLDSRYLEELSIVSMLATAYLEKWAPVRPLDGEGENRMSLAMVAVAERMAETDGRGIGSNARRSRIKRARQRIKRHIGHHPIVFSEGQDAFFLNPGLFWLAKLPTSKGRPVEQTEHNNPLGEPF